MADRVGQQLGNYKLVRLLGQGGFAEVYEGEHIILKQRRAIKILHTALNENEILSFRTEAERLARLSHPHIVPIVDFDEREGFPYLVMEYAPHGSLRNRHPKGTRVPLPTIIDYTKQIASALQYIHDQRLIHRDVKPENMLIGTNNQILLSDIGLAEVAHSEQSRLPQAIVGTPHYMAPEHFRGKAEPASDQYSLGVVVYEWLSGKLPFENGDFLQLGFQHASETPRALREIVPTIPEDVENVVMTALAKDPKERFANVQAFAEALENASISQASQLTLIQPAPSQTQQTIPTQATQHSQTTPSVGNEEPVELQPPQPIMPTPVHSPQEHKRTTIILSISLALALLVLLAIALNAFSRLPHIPLSSVPTQQPTSNSSKTTFCHTNSSGITLYVDPNYGGYCHTFTPGDYDLASFHLDQNVSSLKDPNGLYHITFDDKSNRPGYFDCDKPQLPPDWNDQAHSMRVEKNNPPATCKV